MKNLLLLLWNLNNCLIYFFIDIIGIIWYGKMPKVSLHHRIMRNENHTFKDTYNRLDTQTTRLEDVPDYIKKQIITDYINRLDNDIRFKANLRSVNIPIFDGKDIIGNESIFGLLNDNI